jgi:hypothetical protein
MGAPFGGAANCGAVAKPPPCMTTSMGTLPCRFRFAAAEVEWETATPATAATAGGGGRAAGSSRADWGGARSIGVASGWEGSMVAVVGRVRGRGGEISGGGSDRGRKGKRAQ